MRAGNKYLPTIACLEYRTRMQKRDYNQTHFIAHSVIFLTLSSPTTT
jgi:hypothetical protein